MRAKGQNKRREANQAGGNREGRGRKILKYHHHFLAREGRERAPLIFIGGI
jgi:hypothetical protein